MFHSTKIFHFHSIYLFINFKTSHSSENYILKIILIKFELKKSKEIKLYDKTIYI